MAPLKFCANISWLFTEMPDFSHRIHAAASAGFQAVEAGWLYDSDLKELQRAKAAAGVEVVLINTPPGKLPTGSFRGGERPASGPYASRDVKAGDLGLGAVPGREAEFRQGLVIAIEYAKALDCKRIHLMAGRIPVGSHRKAVVKEMEAIFVQNLTYAADILSKEGITGLIEPINTRITDPRYFLDCPHQAAVILGKVGKPNIKLQMDIFHWQIMDGNLTQNIKKYFPIIGHIQIAQVPGRNEPDSAGELNYNYLFNTLENYGYLGYIGCEYKPLGSTKEGLGWIKDYWTQQVTTR
ncbi:putative hydroxypyruvate isomerase isoform X1 [Hippoglossus hippoglossus]|uniref:putative hydroxypyruvate isomerase isoform X1 n=1 Tax=Hippoglossus hippoglossus TaxID=8267 RepID=UPI00148CF088|nr:putative hydroxypyruvate isomerase isoform X1 [Hippoglossus hippoglossus]